MKLRMTWMLLLIFSLFGTVELLHAQMLDKENLELSVMAEDRIQKSVNNILGPNSRAVVNVYLQSKTEAPVRDAIEISTDSTAEDIQEDIAENTTPETPWYLPNSYVTQHSSQSSLSPMTSRAAEVVVQVEEAVSADVQEQIAIVSRRILRGIPTQVEVLTNLEAALPPVSDSSRAPASLADAEPEKELSEVQKLLEKIKGAEPIIAGLLVLVGLIMAFGFLGLMLRSSAKSLTDGIKQINTRVTNSGSQKIELSKESRPEEEEPKKEKPEVDSRPKPQLPPYPFVGEEAEKVIQTVEGYIKENPTTFMKSITDEGDDLSGLKFLISRISPESRLIVKEILGADHINKAAAHKNDEKIASFDARSWTQNLSEQIEIQLLAGKGVVEEAVNSEQSLVLSSSPPESLFTQALKAQSPVVWRIATEFLSNTYLQEHSDDLDDEALKFLVQSTETEDIAEISNAAKELVESLRDGSADQERLSPAKANSSQFFIEKILPAIAESVLSRELGEDDDALRTLMELSPEYSEILNERIWTPSKLKQIPDENLQEIFSGIDDERKASIIFKLPAEHKERLTSFVPKGNSKRIVADLITKLEKNASEKKHQEMKELTREFLDYLRSQFNLGKLPLDAPRSNESTAELQRKAS